MANPKPKPPNCKKHSSYSCKASGDCQKQSNFNYTAAQDKLGVLNANSQQITSVALQIGDNL